MLFLFLLYVKPILTALSIADDTGPCHDPLVTAIGYRYFETLFRTYIKDGQNTIKRWINMYNA